MIWDELREGVWLKEGTKGGDHLNKV